MSAASASEVAANAGSAPEAVPVIEPMVWSDEPEAAAGIISRFVYLWIQPLFTRARFLHQNGMPWSKTTCPPFPTSTKGGP